MEDVAESAAPDTTHAHPRTGRAGLGPPPPALGARGRAVLCAASGLLAVGMTWPLVLHLGSQVARDVADPLSLAWRAAWGGHALLFHPLHLFDSNTFWPSARSLAFSDSLLGYSPVGVLGGGIGPAVVRYNLLFLFSYALAFAGAFLLARELGARWPAAAVAGAAFAFGPWRLSHMGHLNVLSSGGIPLALALLIRGHRTHRPSTVFAGWVVAAWQVTLGFALGLQLAYLLAAMVPLVVVAWWRRGRPRMDRAVRRAAAAGVALFIGVSALMSIPYLEVNQAYPDTTRSLDYVDAFSPPPSGLLAAPPESIVWGALTEPARRSLTSIPEQTIFPGAAIVVLALVGLAFARVPRSLRIGIAVGIVITGVLALGTRFFGGRFTYRLLYDFGPGWKGVRTTGRLVTLTTLGLGLLGALGAHRLSERRTGWLRTGIPLALAWIVLIEGSGWIEHPDVPLPPAIEASVGGPRLDLPSDDIHDAAYMLWSVEGFPPIVNGSSSIAPPLIGEVRERTASFPDAASVEFLRSLGVRVVVLHLDGIRGTPWALATSRPVTGLPLTATATSDTVVYRLAPKASEPSG